MRFASPGESSAEGRNRGQLLCNVNFMKYLGRHLAFHDRYLKMHDEEVFCHLSLKMIADLLGAFFSSRNAPRLTLNRNYVMRDSKETIGQERSRVEKGAAV